MKRTDKKKLIVVLGMHRSGTSAITRGLKTLGVELGDRLIPAIAGNNDKGFWEDLDIAVFNNELLQFLGYDWHTLSPIQHSELLQENLHPFKLRAIELLRGKLDGKEIFGLKDPRMARLLPFWKNVFKYLDLEVGYVVAIRHPLSVVESLTRRDGFGARKGAYLWLGHVVPSILESKDNPRVVVDYDLLITQPKKQLSRISRLLDLSFEASSSEVNEYVNEFLTSDLRHTQFDVSELNSLHDTPNDVVSAYNILLGAAADEPTLRPELAYETFKEINKRMHDMRSAFLYMAECERKIDDAQRKIDDLCRIATYREEQVVHLNRQIEALLSSTSWRMTEPFRFVGSMLKRKLKP